MIEWKQKCNIEILTIYEVAVNEEKKEKRGSRSKVN